MRYTGTCSSRQHSARAFVFTLAASVVGLALVATAQATEVCGCAADLDNSGSVNAADLSLLLGAWNSSDPNADLNGDGIVNAADLSVILGAWGACGAAANDDCSDGVQLPVAYDFAIPFCTLLATTDGPEESMCDASSSAQIYNDVWYSVTAPTAGVLVVDTCESDFDTRLAVYAPGIFGSTCPGGFLSAFVIGCNDDVGSGNGCGSRLSSQVSVPVNSGSTYSIRVGGYLGDRGTGVLGVHFHPTGDLCSNAIPVTLADPGLGDGVTVILTGDTTHATPSTPIANLSSCGGALDTKDVWFKVTVNCQSGGDQPVELLASTCMPGTNFDTTLAIFSGACESMTELDCNDDATGTSCTLNGVERKSRVSIDPDNTTDTYFVRLAGFNGATGQYEIKLHFQCLNF